jgi:thiol-disulfide isomerase/thioredoxin
MRTKLLTISLILCLFSLRSQTTVPIYKIDGLLKRMSGSDSTYIINFWATWCKPCVRELPAFDSLFHETKNQKVKIILVSLDFKEDTEKKVIPFLKRQQTVCEVVLLDEVNGNDFIDKISKKWTGAIPGTLFKRGAKMEFRESKLNLKELKDGVLVVSY